MLRLRVFNGRTTLVPEAPRPEPHIPDYGAQVRIFEALAFPGTALQKDCF